MIPPGPSCVFWPKGRYMVAYLVEHPPVQRQFKDRGTKPSGVCIVHTAESAPDTVGPDDGAENVAAWIARRTDFGSYHDLADSDSGLQLVPYAMQAYGDGTGSNPHAYHVSAATQAHRWASLPSAWRASTATNMGRRAARYAKWIKSEHGVIIPARRITRAQSDARVPGFLTHAERDPERRSDPGKDFPWDAFWEGFEGGQSVPMPTRGEAVEKAIVLTRRAKEELEDAIGGPARRAELEAAEDAVAQALRQLRNIKILNTKN